MAINVRGDINPMQAPLEGLQLIEASAGTGKTYTISGLFLRLLLEKQLPVQNILVVTFTKAATEELRDRIRKRLVDALLLFTAGIAGEEVTSKDDLLLDLFANSSDKMVDLNLLRVAVFSFDQVPLLTIHAFSQRVLQDHAFGAAVPFECELLEDESELFQQVVDDYWRKLIHDVPSPVLESLVLSGGISTISAGLRSWADKPVISIPSCERPGNDGEREWLDAVAEFKVAWDAAGEAKEYLQRSVDLNRSKLSGKVAARIIKAYDRLLVGGPLPKDAERFGSEFILAPDKAKKGKQVRDFPLYYAVDRLLEAYLNYQNWLGSWRQALQLDLLTTLRKELPERKQQQRVRGYSDFLSDLNVALESDAAKELIGGVRSKFSAALIDEFQDTDELQFSNFYRLFAGADTNMPVFMVGDPKQAIYSFRGADIYAYLNARKKAENSYSLATNWRSVPPLVQAVNTLFVRRADPFVLDDIQYTPVVAADTEHDKLHLPEEFGTAAMSLMRLPDNEGNKLRTEASAIQESLQHCTYSIAAILNAANAGRAFIESAKGEKRNVRGSDIAVIVRSNSQGEQVQSMLSDLGVNAVRTDQATVWSSDEANSILRLLVAMSDPRPPVVRAALATPLFGFTVKQLRSLNEDEKAWDDWLLALRRWRGLWREHGLARCWQQIAIEQRVSERLLNQRRGSRLLTNTNHVIELLAAESERQGWDTTATLHWLQHRIAEPSGEAALLRLDSDDELVQIVTVHKSKGLEYPLVYCPAAFGSGRDPKGLISWHDEQGKAVLGFAESATTEVLLGWQKEQLAEDMRLLYVALTRAAQRCWLYCGAFNAETNKNALAWLLHGGEETVGDMSSIIEDSEPSSVAVIDVELISDSGLVDSADEAAECVENAEQKVTSRGELAARVATRAIRQSWRLTSFTGISHSLQVRVASEVAGEAASEASSYVATAEDYDQQAKAIPTDTSEIELLGPHAFPRGARAGTCLHWMLENMNFAAADEAHLEDIAERGLERYGYSAEWQSNAVQILRQTISAPLLDSGASLEQLQAGTWLPEMEFHFPLHSLRGEVLFSVLKEQGFGAGTTIASRLENRGFPAIDGYMKGFIDLIFESGGRYYLADYKSNWLGPDSSAYGAEVMTDAIAEADYFLQYLIYSVALHRYLESRIEGYCYEQHFGGCLYLFIRGMGDDKNGVYFDRPNEELLRRLDALIFSG